MRPKLTIEQMQALAQEKNGVCLSKTYVHSHTKLRWRCVEGHEFEATPAHVKNADTWCPVCAGNLRRGTIEQMQALAQERKGVCLSTVYVNNRTKLRWRCAAGHEWEAVPNNLKQGQWCPACAGKLRGTIEQMQALAKERKGICLSTVYVNNKAPLRWRCAEGHEWEAIPSSVRPGGGWCPTCSQGSSERIVRDICEQLFGTQFPKGRPKWLVNWRGNRMELDGYCKKLSLAFEYQGKQHYEPSRMFHTASQTLGQRKADDARKRKLCRANGVHLLAIPYTVELDDVPAYIVAEVKNLNLSVHMRPPDTVNVAQFVLPEKLRSIQVLARAHDGGECLSTGYVNALTALRWRCAEGHEWEATPNNVQNLRHWCPVCAGNRPNTIEQMQALAKEHHGKCLSSKYVNAHTKLRWRCVEGHVWESKPMDMKARVKRGNWCTKCPRVAQRPAPA